MLNIKKIKQVRGVHSIWITSDTRDQLVAFCIEHELHPGDLFAHLEAEDADGKPMYEGKMVHYDTFYTAYYEAKGEVRPAKQ